MLRIDRSHADEMIAHALEEDPNECCGILAGIDDRVHYLYRITNGVRSPYRYLMDPQQFLNAWHDAESYGWEFVAFYHSHTHGPDHPSQTDVRMALQSGYLDVHYILVLIEDKTDPQIGAFRIDEAGGVTEEGFQVG